MRFKLYRPRPDKRAAPPLRTPTHPYVEPINPVVSMIDPNTFRLLNLDGNCSDASHWHNHGRSQLWIYNLHYFDDLNAKKSALRRPWHEELVDRWIDENSPGSGAGWDAYPVSRRVVNWIKWSLRGNVLTAKARHSLAVQARWLARRVEFHLQGNHVFANAKALVCAGLYFEGEEAEGWLRYGLSLMSAEISKQVLADGGHFERSPMYHAGFIEDLLDTVGILQAFGTTVSAEWSATIERMLAWLDVMSHPDGDIAFFNDAAFNISPAVGQLRAYAARLAVTLNPAESFGFRQLMPSGYIGIYLPPFFLVCDIAPIGPDHLPAHAHADALSFEMSFRGRRVFVNSGISEYGTGAERLRQRGTAAHNTLVIDDADSSEMWAGFRVARRSRARLLYAKEETTGIAVAGEHDGYRRLPGKNLHRRRWRLTARELRIEDAVEGPFQSAKCYFHLHPEILVHRIRERDLQLSDSRGMLLDIRFDGAASVDIVDSTWHPEFGVNLSNRCIVARLDGPSLETTIRADDSH